MKKLILPLLFAFATLNAVATVFDARSRLVISDLQRAEAVAKAPKLQRENQSDKAVYIPLLLRFNPDGGLQFLEKLGTVIFYTREDMALCCVPIENVEDLDNDNYIRKVEVMSTAGYNLDKSRSFSGVDAVHRGVGVDIQGYDGSGVVAGFCDIGFDPEHVAFHGRVGMMVTYKDTLAVRQVYAPGTSLDNGGSLACERNDELHATHVANILAGGYKGNAFYGAAPGAEIAATVSDLSTMALLCGIEDIIAYAKEAGKPAVVNLSMSSHLGAHDGTDLTNRYLDLLGKEAIIVFSAGNSGDSRQSLSHTFSADYPEVITYFDNIAWDGRMVNGNLDIWAMDSNPFELQIVVCDKESHSVIYRSDWINPKNSAGTDGMRLFKAEGGVWDVCFPEDNYLNVSWGVDDANNRFCYALSLSVSPNESMEYNGSYLSKYNLGCAIRGAEGTHIDVFTGTSLTLMDYTPGARHGNAEFSINNMCCNDNTICVGSWNTRNSIPLISGGTHVFNFQENTSTKFSSYSTLYNGRRLPDVCAPGNYVVSALSTPCVENTEISPYPWISFAEDINGRKNYWGGQCGTSMASPMAAGIFALWLQADPTLNVQEVRQIAQATARRDFADISDPHWGASGALDAAAGLRAVIDRAGVENVENPLVVCVNADRTISVTLGALPVPFVVYNMQGGIADATNALQPGIYVVVAQDYTQKIKI